MRRKRRLVRILLILAEAFLVSYTVYLFCAGYADRAPLLIVGAIVLALPLVKSLRSREDDRDLARVERVYAPYLTDCFTRAPRLRRALLTVLLDTLTDKPHPPVTPRLSAFLSPWRMKTRLPPYCTAKSNKMKSRAGRGFFNWL